MSAWRARFELVAGPNDGLAFTISDEGIALEGELLGPPPGSGLTPKDLDDLAIAVGAEGVTATSEVTFWLNGTEVNGTQTLHDGDIVRIGMTEMLLLEHAGGAAPAGEMGGGEGRPQGFPGAEGAGSNPGRPPRKCLRPGCGALNPPDAKWCSVCGWDLEEPA